MNNRRRRGCGILIESDRGKERLEKLSNQSSFTKFVQTLENLYLQNIQSVNNEEVKEGFNLKKKQRTKGGVQSKKKKKCGIFP